MRRGPALSLTVTRERAENDSCKFSLSTAFANTSARYTGARRPAATRANPFDSSPANRNCAPTGQSHRSPGPGAGLRLPVAGATQTGAVGTHTHRQASPRVDHRRTAARPCVTRSLSHCVILPNRRTHRHPSMPGFVPVPDGDVHSSPGCQPREKTVPRLRWSVPERDAYPLNPIPIRRRRTTTKYAERVPERSFN